MAVLETLNPQVRLDVISRLAQSLKSEFTAKENLLKISFGAWTDAESAEELVKAIRESRKSIRQITEM